MDEISRKRAVGALAVSRKGSGLVLRDTTDNRDQNAQFCNRLGCSGRLKSMRNTQIGFPEKAKSSRTSFHSSSNGKEIIGSSSKTCPGVSNSKKSFLAPRKKGPSQIETDSSETSSVQDEPDVLEFITSAGKIQRGVQPQAEDAESGDVTLMEVGSSSIASNTRRQKNIHQKSRLGNQETPMVSSVSLASKSTYPGLRHGASASRCNLRNMRCNSISDVIPAGCSSSESNLNRRKDMVKKRSSEGQSSSSSMGKKMSGPSLLEEKRNSSSSRGISISDSRRSRNWLPSSGDNSVGSVRTRRPINDNSRARLSNNSNVNNLSPIESPAMNPQLEIAGSVNASSSSNQFSAESSPRHPNSCSRPGSSSENVRTRMPIGPAEVGFTRSLMNRDGMRCYNMDGIAEVLLALERIEQDEEITYEQLVVLETNLFLNGLAFHDQHRDMRLDIDNMSYEELLDLEERMGTVSTALSEEALLKSLRRSIYEPASPETEVMGCGGDYDDVKCSICQEEYSDGDEVGRLQCEHRYHVLCIQQWLRLKNWCPICKASAAPSPSSSPS